jgi:stringent starvation protein B
MTKDQEKRAAALHLYRNQESLFVYVDTAEPGVRVPERLRERGMIVLQIGAHLPNPIKHLVWSDDGFGAELSFGGVGFHCVVPWAAVHALAGQDGKGLIYNPDKVAGLLAPLVEEPSKIRPVLRVIKGGKS